MNSLFVAITWLGHSCFLINTAGGHRIVTDPFGEIGYKPPAVQADVVFVSHNHRDHNAAELLLGSPKVVPPLSDSTPETGRVELPGAEAVAYKSIPTRHGVPEDGRDRGQVTIRVIEVDGLRICHLGDLGEDLSPEQVREIGPVDILMVPAGGRYTIDAAGAKRVVKKLNPRIAVPMHYKTPALNFELGTVDEFLKGYKNVQKERVLRASRDTLPKETAIVVLSY